MNREIKFRAWDILLKEMNKHSSILNMVIEFNGENGTFRLNDNRYVLMQYTGLKDKKGVEIYEGDIIRCVDLYVVKNGIVQIEDYVPYDKLISGFYLKEINLKTIEPTEHHYNLEGIERCEVIGNIYENPELLEEIVGEK